MKTFGVSMEEVQKLRQFQLYLMEKNFKAVGNRAKVEKLEFIGMVQLKSEKDPIPEIKKVCVASQSIYIDDGLIVITKSRIFKITPNNNEVIVKFHMPLYSLGSTLTLSFLRSDIKDRFLEALGDVNENYESDTSSKGALSPPHSDTSSGDSN